MDLGCFQDHIGGFLGSVCKVEKVESRRSNDSQKSADFGDDFGHKMDLETSSRPLGTTIFEEI